MKNLTIVVDDDVAEWARVHAAREGSSVSRIVGELLGRLKAEEEGYSSAMEDWMARPARPLKRGGRYPARDDLHER